MSGMGEGVKVGTLNSLDGLTISNCTFANNSVYGIWVAPGVAVTNSTISSSTISGTPGPGILWTLGNGLTIASTSVTGSTGAGGYGLEIQGVANVTLNNVTATGNNLANAYIFFSGATNSSNVTITGGTYSNSTTAQGIYLVKVNTFGISGTVTNSNKLHGILLQGDTNGTLTGLTSSNNISGSGVYVQDASGGVVSSNISVTNSQFSYNDVAGQSQSGLKFYGAGNTGYAYNVTSDHNGDDGFDAGDSFSGAVFDHCTADTNGVDGVGANGDGFSFHGSSSGTIKNSVAKNNLKSAFAQITSGTMTMTNNLLYNATNGTIALVYLTEGTLGNYTLVNNTIYSGAHTGEGIRVGSSNVTMKNNIVYGFDYGIRSLGGAGTITNDYNDVYGATTANFSGVTPGAHNIQVNPNLVNPMTDFHLQSLSPAIDVGTTAGLVSTSTDYASKPLYGTPDIGAYEYQPPFTLGTSLVDPTGNIRIYGDGKYRYTTATSSTMLAYFSVAPAEGSWTYAASTTRPEWLNVSNFTWNTGGTYSKAWTASSSVATVAPYGVQATTTVYTIGNLLPSTYYDFAVDGAATSSVQTNGSGRATYTYSAGYASPHTFTVTQTILVPTISTVAASVVSTSTATMNASITDTGGADATESGFAYGTVADLSTVIATITLGAQTGTTTFSQSLTGLTQNTVYYFRAYAVNSAGTSTGSILSATTSAIIVPDAVPDTAPTITTSVSSSGGSASSRVANLLAMGNYTLAQKIAKQYGITIPAQNVPVNISSTPVPNSHQFFTRTLKIGISNSDVRKLQIFLNAHGFIVSSTGAGSLGHETTYFGPATKSALMRFQLAHKAQTLDPQGLKAPTGFFGMDTMRVVNGMMK